MLVAYVTCAGEKEASKIASAALKARLAACANYWRGKSVFNWRGRRRKASEWFLLLKTTAAKYPALEKLVKRLHSYEVPAVMAFEPVAASKQFCCWVDEEVK
ncbi:MAG: divalent-cation tolerance protein CutA [Candidatus Micrarchaeota archaeon]